MTRIIAAIPLPDIPVMDLLQMVDGQVRDHFVMVLVPDNMDPLDRENEACRVDDQAAVDTGLEQYES